jgi:polar amino acid transport system substrate-binding protein
MGCGAVIASTMLSLTLAAAEPVTIGTEVPFPPYTYFDAEGQIIGLDRDIADEVCRRAVLDCTLQPTRFDLLLPGVMTGRFDLVIAGIAITPERMQLVDFSQPYLLDDGEMSFYLGLPSAPPPDAARIAVQSGTIYESHLRDTARQFSSFPTEAEVLQALRAGLADLAYGAFNDATGDALIAEQGYQFLYPEPLPDLGTAMAVCKGNHDLLDMVNAALSEMIADGTLDEIADRWL